MQKKPKGVTTQKKALDEYILMVLLVLLLKRVHFLVNETCKGVTIQNALSEYILMVLFVLCEGSSFSQFSKRNPNGVTTQMKPLHEYISFGVTVCVIIERESIFLLFF